MYNTEYEKGATYELDWVTEVPAVEVIYRHDEKGNAFFLIGLAVQLSRILQLDSAMITEQMTSGDYDNLVDVFNTNFNEFFIVV